MIKILDKSNCCGCESCVQSCPRNCISFHEDEYGFGYPVVNTENCLNCGLCEKACPILNPFSKTSPLSVKAAINSDGEIRNISSSGGLFSLLAEYVLDNGGVVFGARFDENWTVCHDYVDNKNDLSKLRGAKYVQSRVNTTFAKVKDFLNSQRLVLFSGTPCQSASLRRYLHKDYKNLLVVDILCHGVPSPKVWKSHLMTIVDDDLTCIEDISFRNKTKGWYHYGLSVKYRNKNGSIVHYYKDKFHDTFLRGFMYDTFLRDSCFNCKFKEGSSSSDIMLADYWGIENEHPNLFDNKGCSCVIAFTSKGVKFLDKINFQYEDSSLDKFVKQNPSFCKQHKVPANRAKFLTSFKKYGGEYALHHYSGLSFLENLRRFIIIILQKTKIIKLIQK